MWIEPNGVVKIIRNIDLDSLYDNTIYFETRQTQYNYFSFKAKYTYPKVTYQRVNKNHIRVEINAENLYDCNYIMFQNTSFGDRWFYAFIKKVEYIANMVSDIEYEIDEIQTWFLDCEMGLTFVEREHSLRDTLGENRVDENLETGEYIINSMTQSGNFDTSVVVVASTTGKDNSGSFYNYGIDIISGLPTGLNYQWKYDSDDANAFTLTSAGLGLLDLYIQDLISADKYDSIVDVFIVPLEFLTNVGRFDAETFNYTLTKQTTLDGYTPKNNKLLQAPYNVLAITDMRGNLGEYYYEDFGETINDNVVFKYSLSLSCDTSMMITPLNYKKVAENKNEKMVFKGYPHGSWNTDMWSAYIAQNGGVLPMLWKDLKGLGQISRGYSEARYGFISASGRNTEHGEQSMFGGVEQVGLSLISLGEKFRQPPQANGNYNGDIIYADGNHDFWYMKQTIRYEMAQRIDEYFNMYGYATKRVKYPNINSRPVWNYIKTINANIFGNIPADSLAKIKQIFDRGITFWKRGDEIGKYNLDNRPE